MQKFCKRIIYISDGEIIFDGLMEEFIKNGTLRGRMLEEFANE